MPVNFNELVALRGWSRDDLKSVIPADAWTLKFYTQSEVDADYVHKSIYDARENVIALNSRGKSFGDGLSSGEDFEELVLPPLDSSPTETSYSSRDINFAVLISFLFGILYFLVILFGYLSWIGVMSHG
jgi:hypothetical protein